MEEFKIENDNEETSEETSEEISEEPMKGTMLQSQDWIKAKYSLKSCMISEATQESPRRATNLTWKCLT